ncbi:MAG: MBL fold metallo-hydrolase [Anaerolineae bacterium]|nr:MBL fold metallo-hydrolase [Gemmatimonadaceae bacterium]
MIQLETVGHVVRIAMSTRWSRAFGYSVSAYLTRGVLIDTGFPDVRADLTALLERVKPSGVILTHHHEDHAGNLDSVVRKKLPLSASPLTLAALQPAERAGMYRRIVWGTMQSLRQVSPVFEHDTMTLIHTPGHSADHHVVWDADRETLFAADLFLGVKVRVARPGEDPRALARSLRAAAALQPRTMFDAHRGLVENPVSALNAKADWLDGMVAAIDSKIAAGQSDAAITREVLGKEDYVGYFSGGDLSKRNFVRAVRATIGSGG